MTTHPAPRDANTQLAVFVGGGADALAVVESTLDGRAYEVEFVDTDDEPYGTIAAMRPDLVVVSLDLADLAGFQLLTMLRLDPRTAGIPVLSYVSDNDVAALGIAGLDPGPATLPAVLLSRVQRH